jgi:hypothetical protein
MVATGIFQQRGKVPTGKNLPWGNFPEENVNFESLKWYSQHFEDTMCWERTQPNVVYISNNNHHVITLYLLSNLVSSKQYIMINILYISNIHA